MGTHRKFYLNTTKWSVYATGLVLVERIEQWTTGAVSWEEILKDHQWTARQLLLWTGGQRGSLMESSLVPRSAVALPLLWGRWQAARGRGVVCEKARQLHYAMSKSSMCWCDQRAVALWTQICALQEREREREGKSRWKIYERLGGDTSRRDSRTQISWLFTRSRFSKATHCAKPSYRARARFAAPADVTDGLRVLYRLKKSRERGEKESEHMPFVYLFASSLYRARVCKNRILLSCALISFIFHDISFLPCICSFRKAPKLRANCCWPLFSSNFFR